MAGHGVSRGRLPGATELGWPSTAQDCEPREETPSPVPGVTGANGMVGPPLEYFSRRAYIAGEVPNDPEFLIRWIEVPQAIEPGTVMPNLGVSEGQARNIAAYLYTLR